MENVYTIAAYSNQDGSNLGYWSNSSDNITKGNPDTWDSLNETELEIERASKIAESKGWLVSFKAQEL